MDFLRDLRLCNNTMGDIITEANIQKKILQKKGNNKDNYNQNRKEDNKTS